MRISATNIEAFRRWLVSEEADSQALIDYLLKKTPPSQAMLAGTAFHKVLELAHDDLNREVIDGFSFDFSKLEQDIYLPAQREMKFEKPYCLNGENHTLVCVIDALDDETLFDHKLTANINAENYTDSMQWRCYLSWLGYDKFTYNLFHGFSSVQTPLQYEIREYIPVTFYRYQNMDEEVNDIVKQFIEFVYLNKEQLTEFIRR